MVLLTSPACDHKPLREVHMRTIVLVMLLLAPAFAHAADTTPAVEAAAQDAEIKAKAVPSTPTMAPLSPSPDMILVPVHDIRDAMLYLGGRASSDEMAAVIYRELGNDFIVAQKAATPQK